MSAEPIPEFIIIGAGGHGRELLEIVERSGWGSQCLGFADDAPSPVNQSKLEHLGYPLLGSVEWAAQSDLQCLLGIGDSATRRRLISQLGGADRALTVIDPSAWISPSAQLGAGVVCCQNVVVTTSATIGENSLLNVGVTVQHDTVIGADCTLSPGVFVNGDVQIGSGVFVGTGAIIARGVSVADGAIIGAGATVLSDVSENSFVAGTPARAISRGDQIRDQAQQ